MMSLAGLKIVAVAYLHVFLGALVTCLIRETYHRSIKLDMCVYTLTHFHKATNNTHAVGPSHYHNVVSHYNAVMM